MLASDYIRLLNDLVEEHGDLECVDTEDEDMNEPEEVEGKFVLADKA